jgi:putative DNA primase/helicase
METELGEIDLSLLGQKHGDRYQCPVCKARRGVAMSKGHNGKLLLYCHASKCDVWNFLRRSKGPSLKQSADHTRDAEARIAEAQGLWERATASRGRPRAYLEGRGIDLHSENLKLLDLNETDALMGRRCPAMIAPVEGWNQNGHLQVQAVHITFLTRGGTRKISGEVPRKARGVVKGGFIVLGPIAETAIVGEGIETVLSAMQLSGITCGLSAISAGNMQTIRLPRDVRRVVIAADNDESGAGQTAAETAAKAFAADGVEVRIAVPSRRFYENKSDWNDAIRRAGHDGQACDRLKEEILAAPIFAADAQLSLDAKTKPDPEAKISAAARLNAFEYERERSALAKELGVRATILDSEVQARRRQHQVERDITAAVELWDSPVEGGEVLSRIKEYVEGYVVLPSQAAIAISLWIMFTYALDAFSHSPFLAIRAPTKRCGKTTLLRFLAMLVQRPLPAANITPAAVFRVIEKFKPTLLIDEFETFVNEREELRGVLNSSHERQFAFVLRCVGEDREATRFSTWAAKAVALNGRMHPTLEDRSIVIELTRKMPGEKVVKLPRYADALEDLRRMCARWAADNIEALRIASPASQAGLNDRANDNWAPLFAVADLCGEKWSCAARQAALAFSGADDDETLGIMLLEDLRGLFHANKAIRLATHLIIERLIELDDRPWSEFHRGKPITPHGLSRLLLPFKVKPIQWRVDSSMRVRGYGADQFEAVFARYLPNQGGESVTS